MVENIYKVRNKCPKCDTEVDCPYTEEIKCVCTKYNCKNEFQKELQGATGISLSMNGEMYVMTIDATGQKTKYAQYDTMEKDLNVLREQQKIIDLKGETNGK